MSLNDWRQNGWLQDHQTRGREIADLLAVVERDLKDSRTEGLSPDWKLGIAYNAALQAATAALAAAGYRAARDSHHYRVIQSLGLTIGAKPNLVMQLDFFRKKRNIADYERSGMASRQEAEEMLELAEEIRDQVIKWRKEKHPDLLK